MFWFYYRTRLQMCRQAIDICLTTPKVNDSMGESPKTERELSPESVQKGPGVLRAVVQWGRDTLVRGENASREDEANGE